MGVAIGIMPDNAPITASGFIYGLLLLQRPPARCTATSFAPGKRRINLWAPTASAASGTLHGNELRAGETTESIGHFWG